MKYTLEYAQECAEEHGGICLSENYTKMTDKMRWQCAAGHQWEACLKTVRDYHWCLKCKSIECEYAALRRAKDNKIIRIFRDWKGEMSKWQCRSGHQFISANERLHNCAECVEYYERFQKEAAAQSTLYEAVICDIQQDLANERERKQAWDLEVQERRRKADEYERCGLMPCGHKDYSERGFSFGCGCW